ncbi:conserved Plasmodium protein, unknown function [Plasmodium gallinaceum]|uniref:Uncharacterized protein n=1 Tax=Plasmodium gallinaceum TaxID=5849 RepID=A0A1J1GVB7_PLAGA|nr:conserved Plasmodium protein, unknown function [Plasmodium gallinaceum]CRG96174.1 conserved Plasmodium protein, unknown function [Plasmodium gallinaceum]
MINKRISNFGSGEFKRILYRYRHIGIIDLCTQHCNYSVLIGKYNKSDKRKFIISSSKKKELKNEFFKNKFKYNKKKKDNEGIYLNKISYKEEKTFSSDKNEIINIDKINNIFIKDFLNKNNIYYLYAYQFLLIELLRYTNVFMNLAYSDCLISYIIYSFYKINSLKTNASNKNILNHQIHNGITDNINVSIDNITNEKIKKKKKKNNFYLDNCVLFLGCSKEQISLIHETIIKLKSIDISTHIISNEKSADNIKSNFFLYNIIILNIENFSDTYDFSILFEHINFIVVDDIYEIYINKKSNILKNILKNCKEKQIKGNNIQILLINKIYDEWIIKEMLHFLKSIKYNIKFEKNLNFFKNEFYSNINDFNCFDLYEYKKSNCKHFSINVPLNEDKKFLILFYLLSENKNKKIIIYYNKNDIYSFYNFINSYIPCIFLPNTYKIKCKSNIINTFNKNSDYILVTNDKNIKKIYEINANLYIHYTFVENVNTYVDIMSNNFFNIKNDKIEEIKNENYNNPYSENNKTSVFEGHIESILFYNKKQYKQYEILNNLINFTNYMLPPLKEMKNNFLNFLIEEIQDVIIDDNKHLEEAGKIYEKYGYSFISASLYYIQKKKLFKKNFKNKSYSNITFIIEKNIILNTKSKLIDFLNDLLNFKKNIGDINFFIQNYLYCKRGYILSVAEDIYNIIHKNKNLKENMEKYKKINMYILYNNYEKNFRSTYVKKGTYKSKKSLRRLKKKLNIKKEHIEMNKLKKWMTSSFKLNRRNVKDKLDSLKAK